MRVRVWGRFYRVRLVGFDLMKNGVRAAAKVRHAHRDILISVLVPRRSRAWVIASAVAYAWQRCPQESRDSGPLVV